MLRLRALIRRSHGHASPRLHCGPLQLDVNAGRFELHGQPLALSPQEFRLLSYFIHHSGQVIGRDRPASRCSKAATPRTPTRWMCCSGACAASSTPN